MQWLPHLAENISSTLVLVIMEAVNTVSYRFLALAMELIHPITTCNSSEDIRLPH